MFAVIGGSGVVGSALMQMERRAVARTPYGEPSGPLVFAKVSGKSTVFIARHGPGHIHPPHKVNYRANIWAVKDAGADAVVSIAAVGGVGVDTAPGAIVIPDQIIDYTYGREHTYFDGGDRQVRHIDFTQPYDAALRTALLSAAESAGERVLSHGTYGATLVGMTGMPEAALARELDLPYAHICVVANWAAGRGSSKEEISHDAIERTMEASIARVASIIAAFAAAR
jgi:5'-methylthioinosine phosphorylase